MAISTTSLFMLVACGGGGGGSDSPAAPAQPPPANVAPTVQAGTDQSIELPTATAQLSGSATDDSSTSTLTYSWAATSGPSGVTFGSATAAATSVTFPSAGSFVLTLSVSDGSATGTDAVTVTVNAATYPASDTTNDRADHGWARVAAATDVGMSQTQLDQASAYALTGGGAGMIVRRGRLVHAWGDIDQRFDLKSTTKSMGGIALGLALDTGSIALTDLAQAKLSTIGADPSSNIATGWLDDITVLQLATHTAGFAKPGGYVPLAYQPGTTWSYSDAGLNWLSEVLTAVFNQDLAGVLNTQVWTALGLNSSVGGTGNAATGSTSDVHWRDNQFRDNSTAPIHNRELASGIYANVNAMARVGLLFLRKGLWANDQRILSEAFVNTVRTPSPTIAGATIPASIAADFPSATTNYGVLWWTNTTGLLPNVPRDAFWAWGLGDSLIIVIPSLDIVAVRAGPQQGTPTTGRTWNDADWNGDYAVLAPFIDPIVQSVTP